MAKKILRLPSISRVAAGSRAILELPIGPTYKRIVFVGAASAGLLASHIGRIDVNANAKTIQTFKNYQRVADLNAFYNRSPDSISGTAVEFALHFERSELHSLADRRGPGIGTADLATFTVEVELITGLPASFTLQAYAEIDPVPQALGMFTRIREFPFNAPAAGIVEMDKFPRSGLYQAIHMQKSDITLVEVEANGNKIVDATTAVLHRIAKEGSPVKRVPVTGYTHLDMTTDGDLFQAIRADVLGDFRLKMTVATSGAFDLVTETLDSLDAI